MSNLDVIDVIDMLEKKHNFTREDARMLIDFNNARLSTKDDLNFVNLELSNKISSTKQELSNKIDFVKQEIESKMNLNKQEIESKIEKEINSVKEEIKSLRTEFSWMKGIGIAILVSVFAQILTTVFSK